MPWVVIKLEETLEQLQNKFRERGYYDFINKNPVILDLLYELDLLPEQCDSVSKFERMFKVVIALNTFEEIILERALEMYKPC